MKLSFDTINIIFYLLSTRLGIENTQKKNKIAEIKSFFYLKTIALRIVKAIDYLLILEFIDSSPLLWKAMKIFIIQEKKLITTVKDKIKNPIKHFKKEKSKPLKL